MSFDSVLEGRRSVRAYDENKKVTSEQVEQLVQAAIYAPSWKNSQTARYYCAVSEQGIEKVKSCLPEFNANNSQNAALIVTTFVSNRSGFNRDGSPDNECANGWGYYDLRLHNENLVLKAYEMGLGTLIMGIRDGDALRCALNIPDTETVVSVIAVGYPAASPEMPKRKSPKQDTNKEKHCLPQRTTMAHGVYSNSSGVIKMLTI